jgi:transcription-repair coupling factor (superfamily II helicase)
MSSKELDQIIGNFYNQKFDLLLSTSIIESGLDIPTANTIIVYNANLFGLAQLYQLRGRVGRSKLQSFAYFTISTNKDLTERAIKRLEVLQSLDSLGAGFSLASHDLDIRGAGNILGDEQSGHVKEVGYELYQTMLEETISNINSKNEQTLEKWSPVIKLGLTFLIPDNYVEDLQLRLGLYKRLSNLNNDSELESFSNEMVDRFGGLPDAFTNLIKVIKIKRKCKISNISKIEAGPKGVVISFYDKKFNNADGLINWIDQTRLNIKIKNNGQLIVYMNWRNTKEQLDSIDLIVTKIYDISKLKTV